MNAHAGARPRRTQRERRERSQHLMLEAATRLIARQGSGRTTLSQIGAAAGYTHGLVSHRFGCKRELVRTLIRRLQGDFARSIQPELLGRRGLRALKIVCESYLSAAARSERLALYVLIGEALGPVPEIRGDLAVADEAFRRAVEQLLEQAREDGETRAGIDCETQSALLVATLRGLVIQRILNREAFDLKRATRAIVNNLERALKPARGAA